VSEALPGVGTYYTFELVPEGTERASVLIDKKVNLGLAMGHVEEGTDRWVQTRMYGRRSAAGAYTAEYGPVWINSKNPEGKEIQSAKKPHNGLNEDWVEWVTCVYEPFIIAADIECSTVDEGETFLHDDDASKPGPRCDSVTIDAGEKASMQQSLVAYNQHQGGPDT
jgi:hypothetical protein